MSIYLGKLSIITILISGIVSSYTYSSDINISEVHQTQESTKTIQPVTLSEDLDLKTISDSTNNKNEPLNSIKNDSTQEINLNLILEQNRVLRSEIMELKRQIEIRPTNESFNLLTTSFYERLRTTDDSINMWGTITGWFGAFITLVLAAMAIMHFGGFRELKNETKRVLNDAKRDSRVAANAAVTDARIKAESATTKLVSEFLDDKGIKQIEIKINQFNSQISHAEEKLSRIDRTLELANNSVVNLQQKEAMIISTSKDNEDIKNKDIIEYFGKLNKDRTFQESTNILNNYFTKSNYRDALKIIKTINKELLSAQETLTLDQYEAFCYCQLSIHNKACSLYHSQLNKLLDIETFERQQENVNSFIILHNISYSLMKEGQPENAKAIISFLMDLVFNKSYKYQYVPALMTILDKCNNGTLVEQYIEKSIEIFSDDPKVCYNLNRFRLSRAIEMNVDFSFDYNEFLDSSTDKQDESNAYALITHHLFTQKKWLELLVKYEEYKTKTTKEEIRINDGSYIAILLNRAYAYYNLGSKRKSYHLMKYIRNQCNKRLSLKSIKDLDEYKYLIDNLKL
ncbi:hypothetical protein [Vibrio crassostreae]|uniref:hypothetical protein n=1 Tax=Vibrio crassostreae TaxID=246167 RepID=UPI000F461E2F|nr:hypothetical protein [Vibrio crassostreae]ROO49146.1 hypothetical protein EDB56_11368 [Vibrio crassostreae]